MKRLLPLFATAALLVTAPALAQYVFVDVDGDGMCTVADMIDDTVTSIDIYIDTNHDAGGSVNTCAIDGGSPLSILSYEFILHSSGQNDVTWGAFTNNIGTFTTPFATASDGWDYHTGFGGTAPLTEGKYKVGSLAITVATGKTPAIAPVPVSGLDANFYTAFGSECPGNDYDNTIKLGSEFTAACGPSAPTSVRATTWGAIKKIYGN